MIMKSAQLIAVFSVLILISCSKPEPEAVSEPEAADEPAASAESLPEPDVGSVGGSDPTVVDAEHYKTELENEAVRVLRITYGPGEESVMHYHPNSVAVFLTDISIEMTMPDGSTEEISGAAGDAVFNPAGEHRGKNLSDSPFEVIEVELKARDSAPAETSGPDATVVDADHYTAEFENDAVRILRIAYDAGDESVMHYHPDSVAVFVTDQLVEMTMPDGSTEEISAAAGDVLFVAAGNHLPRNISDSAWEVILVELKQ